MPFPVSAVWSPTQLHDALLRTAIGDRQLEEALQLVIDEGPHVFALLAARLVSVQPDIDDLGGGLWAELEWTEVDEALREHQLRATPNQVAALSRAAHLSGMVPDSVAGGPPAG